MGKVTALLAGERLSPQEILAEALGECQDGRVAAVVVLTLDDKGNPDVTCSAIPVKDLTFLARAFDHFVDDVARGSYLREDDE